MKKSFASDNNSGVHPAVLKAIVDVNPGDALAYGEDPVTGLALGKFKSLFGSDAEAFLFINGTGANVAALMAMTRPYNSVICPETAHINVDECNAPERLCGCKLQTIKTDDGKLTVDLIEENIVFSSEEHNARPGVVSITQPTELGTLYTPQEVRVICDYAHRRGMYVHMDGARISNAAAALKVPVADFTVNAGVDVLCFGGTKNGMMYGEAVVFFNRNLSVNFEYLRKQSTQLVSKMRYVSAQFNALLSNDLWIKNADRSNKMAALLAEKIRNIPKVKIIQKVQTNAVFVELPGKAAKKLQKEHYFYILNDSTFESRWMTSFDTEEADIDDFVSALRAALDDS